MIVEANTGAGFMGLARYLVYGPTDGPPQPDRVDWIEARNLPTHDAEAAARFMRATANDSERVQKPVYHLSISFDPNDPVNREVMRQVVDRTLRDLGLQEHQALIVAHKDRAHAHVHVMVNRVHPERCTAWSNSWDFPQIERSVREQERQHGLRVVPGKHSPVPGHERTRPLVRGDAEFLKRVQREAGPHLTGAHSWAELEHGLAGHGLSLRVHHGGFIVTDGVVKVKASEVDRAASRKHLERRLGALGAYRFRQAVAARTLAERATPVHAAPQPHGQELAPSPPPEAPIPRAPAQPVAVRHPAPATPSARVLADERKPRLTPPPPALRQVSGLVREARLLQAEARELGEVFEANYVEARREAARLTALRERAVDDARDLREVLDRVYTDPADALRKLVAYERKHGTSRVLQALRETPKHFGTIRTRHWWTAPALKHLPEALAAVQQALRSSREAPSREALAAAQQRAEEGVKTGIAAREAQSSVLGRYVQCEREAAALLRPLLDRSSPEVIAARLARLLPPEDREAAEIAAQVLKLASHLRGHGNDRGAIDFD